MKRYQNGGGQKKIAYAVDIVILAKPETEMKGMLRKCKKFKDNQKLIMHVNKLKIMVFMKGRRDEILLKVRCSRDRNGERV